MASRRGVIICCGVTVAIIVILVVVAITLLFTVFKPKEPKVQPHPVILQRIEFELLPILKLNLTLLVSVTVKNPNYGSFKYDETKVLIYYRGTQIGEGPIDAGSISSHESEDFNTVIEITAEKMLGSKDFWQDLGGGHFNFTSESKVYGKATLFKLLKKHARGRTTCDITVYLTGRDPDSTCKTKMNI
ncbi:hypothetical protein H6P81_007033 [Aristolochia fimbriata]|uniref:Late embryogenesis abundant protein LEA-2 subgroup domain-containing protein n=1 Tax=Aristolochia fimbriata TaxID=158543 RepID=A0AAV7F049_ARIFI|nr:hypothetical protein H6P81_007033 [Aristolochia fimbriata]